MTATTLEASLKRIALKNFQINTVIDVGASNGCWTDIVSHYLPNAFFFLIEANPYHANALSNFKKSKKNVDFTLAVAGDSVGEMYFDGSDPFSGVAKREPSSDTLLKLPSVSIDSIVLENKLVLPFFLKLDTHGFEKPIFEGASQTLQNTALIVVEVYNFQIANDSLRFHEMCQYLEGKGFRCIDMCDPLFRPADGILWQMDLFFARADHPCFDLKSWQ
jgi:FkbM family methyltransferase